MFKNFHAIVMAAAAGAGLLVLSASPSLACIYVATDPSCGSVPQPQIEHRGARLYNVVPGGSTMNSPRPSAPSHLPRRAAGAENSK
jgi:hypothetical protein